MTVSTVAVSPAGTSGMSVVTVCVVTIVTTVAGIHIGCVTDVCVEDQTTVCIAGMPAVAGVTDSTAVSTAVTAGPGLGWPVTMARLAKSKKRGLLGV
ncbi:hypothetical protein SPBR_01148 [Sporothrix brasiliensis 5110]|uniref:Uncharacterized protein n=1 Tax=Sporothrix brasiliensis 5110 TaxID=1398154 RepID=A0A0C2IU06_9PEZI|nr:uncharacterized protein SPBR_01148 [Sporothrix brasiliensis 5110]KIH90255.1 hypothetical protein SPBR_01148 [Sporothrix brasiliensis 5110]